MSDNKVQGKPSKWVLAALTFSHLSQHFYVGAPILYQSVRADLGLNYSEIGVMTGASNMLGGFLQMAYSIAARRLARRTLLCIANLGMSLGCFLMGIADRFLSLLSGNVAAGVGQAGMHPMGTSIIADKFGRKGVSGALSTFYGLGYIGNIVSPILLSSIAVLMGWRFSFFILALIPLLAGLTVLFYLRGESASDKILPRESQGSLLSEIKSSLRIKGAVSVLVAQSFIASGTGLGVITTWVPQFLRDPTKGFGLDIVQAGVISAVSTGGGVIGTIIVGHLADRFGHLRTAMVCTLSTVVLVYLLTFYPSFTPILLPHLFILGVTTFSITSLLQAHLAIVSPPSQRDILLGLFFTFGFGISSLWTTVLGNLIDTYSSFNAAWIGMSLLGVVALFWLFIAYRSTPRKEQLREITGD
jgi:predicted MFS family arabinose efflux permease